ncbi:MAG: hypothetical protein JWP76_5200 [Dactylosporangium sp.]|nr:hypothetical protein [Dactylosporangium sp.]
MEDSSQEPAAPPLPKARLRPPGRRVLGTVFGAAVLAAGTVTLDRPGLGWLLTGVALIAVVAASSVELRVRPDVRRCLWAAAGIALLAVGTVRAAGWLYVLCVPLAGLCAAQALIDGPSVRAMLVGVLAGPVTVVRALPWAGRGVRELAPRGRPQAVVRLSASIGVSVLLLLVFGALFASADDAFARLLARVVPQVDASGVPRWIFLFVVVAVAGLGAAYLVAAPPRLAEPAEPRRPLRLVEWALPVVLLDALFALFVLVQVAVLFGGRDHVLRPGGPDFAQYARGGFWQLLVVTALTLVVIGVVARAAPRTGRVDRTAIRALVGALAILTLVIVASAMKRMGLYEEAYGYTRLRLVVSAAELWLGLLFVLVLLAGVRLRTAWLPQAVLASAVVGLLALAALDPDRFIAGQNVDRFNRTGRVDLFYLSGLSPDAAPELARLPVQKRSCALELIGRGLSDGQDSWSSYNLGRSRARAIPAQGRCESP